MGSRLITTGLIDSFAVDEVTWVGGTYRTPDFKLWKRGKGGERGLPMDRMLGNVKTGLTPLVGTNDFEFKLMMIPEAGASSSDEIPLMIGRVYEEAVIDTTPTPDVIDWFLLKTGAGAFNEYFGMKDYQLVPSGSVSQNNNIMSMPFGRFVFQKGDHSLGDIEVRIWVAG